MSYALNFDQKVAKPLEKLLPEKRGYRWVPGWSVDKRSKLDVFGLKANIPAFLIEVELKKDNPVRERRKSVALGSEQEAKEPHFVRAGVFGNTTSMMQTASIRPPR
jgi:hypothetical protein